jgi:EAL domain-containing protein (putative c-di-GMP-specific phosphodiesterase class I)
MAARDQRLRQSERQRLLERQLPLRLARLRERSTRLVRHGWDINVLRLLADDAGYLAALCDDLGADALARDLTALHDATAALLDPPRLPDPAQGRQLEALAAALAETPLPDAVGRSAEAASLVVPGPTHDNGFPLLLVPPPDWWRGLAREPPAAGHPHPGAAVESAADQPAVATMAMRSAERRSSERRNEPPGAGPEPVPRADLMRRLDECLAMDDGNTRPGGLLLVALDGQAAPAEAGQRHGLLRGIARHLAAEAGPGHLVAIDEAPADAGVLVLSPERDAALLEAWALALRDRLARQSIEGFESARALVDIGICPFMAGASNAAGMHDCARKALDAARSIGQRGVFVVRDAQHVVDPGLIERIRDALEAGGFELLFQPIVALRGEERAQFQALLRLRDGDGRLHAAAELVPAARHAGLLGAVDAWVLDHCIARLAATTRRDAQPRLFVSQSLEALRDADGPRRLQDALAHHGIGGEAIVLDVRAKAFASAAAALAGNVAAVQALGAGVALSGLDEATVGAIPTALHVDFARVAPHYLQLQDPRIAAELAALVERLHERGTRVIAPRVEDAGSAAALWAAGIDYVQGNFVQAADSDFAFEF